MDKKRPFRPAILFFILTFAFYAYLGAQEGATPASGTAGQNTAGAPKSEEPLAEMPSSIERALSSSENVTLNFTDADIKSVLKVISLKSGVNIVTTPDVLGNISIRLIDVPWETALDVILKTYGFGYQRQGNIILVTKLENVARIQAEEPLRTEVFTLKFLDAVDAQKILIPLLSPRGRISILYTRGQKGWEFGTFKIGKEEAGTAVSALTKEGARQETVSIERNTAGEVISRKAEVQPSIKSRILVISDTPSSLDRIRNVILPQIDVVPKQVLIEARLMEVNLDKLRDLGVDWGTGTSGAHGYTTPPADVKFDAAGTKTIAGRNLASEFAPSIFGPKEGASFTGAYPYSAGAELIFKKLTGTKFEAILHALEEDVNTNTLSAPRILTLDNQEAAILVGFHTPILISTVATSETVAGGTTVTQTLDYYQEIGIRLNVVPQVSEEGFINMLIHPSVTSSSSSVPATTTTDTGHTITTTSYPVIDVREAQTQVLIKDGETIVIGGLLKDVRGKESIGIPFLSKIPMFGGLFRRDTYDTSKVDLLIFITARIIHEGEFNPEEIARLEKGVETFTRKKEIADKKKKKKVR